MSELPSLKKKRQARELRALEPYAWEKFKDKHPPNLAKMGMLPIRDPPKFPSEAEHSGSDTDDVHETGMVASGSRETSPSMRNLAEGPEPGALVHRRRRGGHRDQRWGLPPEQRPCGRAKRPRVEEKPKNVKKARKEEEKKERGRKGDPKQLPLAAFAFPGSARPAAPVSPPAAGGSDLYALLRQSNGPPAPQEAQLPDIPQPAASVPVPAAVEAAAPIPAPAPADADAAPPPPSVPALLALLQPLYDSGRCKGGLRGSYASCYSRMDPGKRAEHAEAVRYFTAVSDLEELEAFMRNTVRPGGQ